MADKEVERVREKIAIEFFKQDCPNGDWQFAHPIQKDRWLTRANRILAISEPLIKADDQSLPEYMKSTEARLYQSAYADAMLKANFVKIVPKGNYEQPKTKDG